MSPNFLCLFQPDVTKIQAKSLSASSLAYLGDAVFELFVRSDNLFPVKKVKAYHHSVVSRVKAEAQASFAQEIYPILNDEEKDIFRRARNAADGKPRRIDLSTYQQATGLEAVLGFLYLTNINRLMEILSHCHHPHHEET